MQVEAPAPADPSESTSEPTVVRAIKARHSCRSYATSPIAEPVLERLASALHAPPQAPFGSPVRLGLVTDRGADDEPRKLGTYGMIRGARSFLAGAVTPTDLALEDFGYVFEWLLLHATGLGLATCWLGATLRRDRFAEALDAKEAELLPAVSPVGYPAARRGVVETVFRWSVASHRRRPSEALFFDESFGVPLAPSEAGPYGSPLEMVRLGPSAMNKQPWRVLREEGRFHFYLHRRRGYERAFELDLQRVDMGIALCHFELTAAAEGLTGSWAIAEPTVGELPPRTSYLCSWVPGAVGE